MTAKQPDVLPERQVLAAQTRLVHGRVQSDAKDRYKRVWKVARSLSGLHDGRSSDDVAWPEAAFSGTRRQEKNRGHKQVSEEAWAWARLVPIRKLGTPSRPCRVFGAVGVRPAQVRREIRTAARPPRHGPRPSGRSRERALYRAGRALHRHTRQPAGHNCGDRSGRADRRARLLRQRHAHRYRDSCAR